MTRFVLYASFSVIALVGMTGQASASFRPVWDSDQVAIATNSVSTATEKPQVNRDAKNPEIGKGILWANHGGMGSVPVTSSNNSSGGLPGALSETNVPATLSSVKLRLANERLAVIPPIRSVFEPPRAI